MIPSEDRSGSERGQCAQAELPEHAAMLVGGARIHGIASR
jgi:hypothetical protein